MVVQVDINYSHIVHTVCLKTENLVFLVTHKPGNDKVSVLLEETMIEWTAIDITYPLTCWPRGQRNIDGLDMIYL